ncbi:MAG: MauE/DoxX family redox-associated membrane protein [Pirellulales bacterium]
MRFSPRALLPTSRGARTAAAVVLLAAATLKARHIEFSPISSQGIWTRPVQMAVVEYELALAVWLFLGVFPRPLRWLTAATFLIFGAFSLNLWMGGAETCSCFGTIDVHPLASFILDAILSLAVLFSKTNQECLQVTTAPAAWPQVFAHQFRLLGATAGCAAAIFFPTHVVGWPMLAQAVGYPLIVERPLQFASARNGHDESVAEFVVRNSTEETITILGAQTSCGCAQIDDLPISVGPYTRTSLRFRAASTQSGETVTHEARLFIDRPSPRIMLHVVVSGKQPASQRAN